MVTVKCIRNINPFSDKPEKEIEIGKSYEVEDISMGQSSTSVTLKDIRGAFNSIYFEFFEDGSPLDIFEDKRFNPYL